VPAATVRARYVGDAVQTTSPVRLLTMLYDRLVQDLATAETSLSTDPFGARRCLDHSLDILSELRASLDVAAWEGGPGLARLYAYLISEVIGANVAGDAARVAACRRIVEPLRDAWHEAATHVLSGQA